MDWIQLAQDKVQLLGFMNMEMNVKFYDIMGFLD
jgi:hypothetical protein